MFHFVLRNERKVFFLLTGIFYNAFIGKTGENAVLSYLPLFNEGLFIRVNVAITKSIRQINSVQFLQEKFNSLQFQISLRDLFFSVIYT
jgi:hypothetical protein